LRELAPIVRRLGNLNSDTVGTVDAWGSGFVDGKFPPTHHLSRTRHRVSPLCVP
jgi:hypothetical protein